MAVLPSEEEPRWAFCLHQYKIMSYTEYKDLLEQEVEQLKLLLPAIREAFTNPIVDGCAKLLDTELLLAIADERRRVGDSLSEEDKTKVEKELGL